ncbi:hypothetical protein V6x_60020 [Gimesia chilikensis]|uniref:Uncharacterized protein n=1 Tax=Gimesia chilikensis TaxID=2605989 RepID=A0A517WLY1_9PLAN|nr:hypothetical protein [Gimesia chilikensis]QDU06250.1 hypothetical protein V6x_60020 [Gimesia chilikensis]
MSSSTTEKKYLEWITISISIIAIVVSILSLWFSSNQFATTKNLSERDRFREYLVKMVREHEKFRIEHPNETGFRKIPEFRRNPEDTDELQVCFRLVRETKYETVLSTQKIFSPPLAIVYFDAAREIEPDISDKITSNEYLILADMAYAHSGIEIADTYIQKAFKKTDKINDTTAATHILLKVAEFQFNKSTESSIKQGRKHYEYAKQKLKEISQAQKRNLEEAELCASWAVSESKVGEHVEANKHFFDAKKYIMKSKHPAKIKWLFDTKIEMAKAESSFKNRPEIWITIGKHNEFIDAINSPFATPTTE